MSTFTLDQSVVCVVRRTREVTTFATGRIVDPDAECPMCGASVLLVQIGEERYAYDIPCTAPLWLLTPHWTCQRKELMPE